MAAALTLAAILRAEADALGTQAVTGRTRRSAPVLASLPPWTFTHSRMWRHQFAAAAQRLGGDAQHWGAPIPRCTGEEMALHLILRRAAVADTNLPADHACAWPSGENPTGWGDLFEYLFQDHDVLMRYDMPPDAAQDMAGGVHLAPHRWFTEFTLEFPVPDRTW